MPEQNKKPVFDKLFDQLENAIGRTGHILDDLFGPEPKYAPQVPLPPKPKDVRIRVEAAHVAKLLAGGELKYKVQGQEITLVAPAKYSREEIADLLKRGAITGDRAEVMLRERA